MVFTIFAKKDMADNYLENKMEALRQGPTIVKRPSITVGGLLKFIREQDREHKEEVMPAELEAIVRDAGLMEEAASFRFDWSGDSIRISGPASPRTRLIEAGEILMAMRLKAAQMHLSSCVEMRPESTSAANPLIATLKVWR